MHAQAEKLYVQDRLQEAGRQIWAPCWRPVPTSTSAAMLRTWRRQWRRLSWRSSRARSIRSEPLTCGLPPVAREALQHSRQV